MPCLSDALFYREHGISVIPVARDKKPLIPWLEFNDRIATKEEIEGWWRKWPDANVGVVTGKISNLAVIDVEAGGDISWIPATAQVSTGGGGWHFWYRWPIEGVKNSAIIRPLTDIRGDHGFVVAPNSLHASGKNYEWIKSDEIAPFPAHLFTNQSKDPFSKAPAQKKDWTVLEQGVTEGGRNETAAKVAGKLLRSIHPNEWESVAWPALSGWNQKNTPPLPENELQAVFRSVAKRAIHDERRPVSKEIRKELSQQVEVSKVAWREALELGEKELLATKPSDFLSYGYNFLDDVLTGIFPGELVVIGGSTGCLHPETKILDPLDGSYLSVKEREKNGKSFHVFSKDKNGKVVITKAAPPRKYRKADMYRLRNGRKEITVTGDHRVWDGRSFVAVRTFAKSSFCRLPSFSDNVLSGWLQDAQHYSGKVEDSPGDYHPLSHLCDRQLLWDQEIDQEFSPLQDDVRALDYADFYEGDLEYRQEYIHPYQLSFRPSTPGLNYLGNNSFGGGFLLQGGQGCALQSHSLSSFFSQFHKYSSRFGKDRRISFSDFLTTDDKTYRDFLALPDTYKTKFNVNNINCSTWEVQRVEDEIYYDFHVPKYENYYAEGLFHHNTGKTTLAMNIIMKAAREGHRCFCFVLEDRLEEYAMKALFFKLNVLARKDTENIKDVYSWNLFRRNSYTDERFRALMIQAKAELANDNIKFIKVSGRMTYEIMEKVIDEEVLDGTEIFLVDHLGYFSLDSSDLGRTNYIDNFMVDLRTMQRRNNARVILIAHYRKLNSAAPTLDSFRDSISIVQNANVVINLYREKPGEREKKKNESLSQQISHFSNNQNERFIKTFFLIPKVRSPNGENVLMVDFDRVAGDYVQTQAQEFKPISDMQNEAPHPQNGGLIETANYDWTK